MNFFPSLREFCSIMASGKTQWGDAMVHGYSIKNLEFCISIIQCFQITRFRFGATEMFEVDYTPLPLFPFNV